MFIHVHTCSYVFIRVHTCSHVFTRVHKCSYVFIRVHTCSYVLIRVHTYTHACIHPSLPPSIHPSIYHTYNTLQYITLHYIKLHYITYFITYVRTCTNYIAFHSITLHCRQTDIQTYIHHMFLTIPCTLTLPQSPSRSSGSPIREIRGAVAMGRTGCLWCRGDQCPPRTTWEVWARFFHDFPWFFHEIRGVSYEFSRKKHPVESFGRDDLLEPFFVWVIFVSWKWLKRFFVQESPLFGGKKRAEKHVVSHRFFHKSMHFSMHQWLCQLVTGEL